MSMSRQKNTQTQSRRAGQKGAEENRIEQMNKERVQEQAPNETEGREQASEWARTKYIEQTKAILRYEWCRLRGSSMCQPIIFVKCNFSFTIYHSLISSRFFFLFIVVVVVVFFIFYSILKLTQCAYIIY